MSEANARKRLQGLRKNPEAGRYLVTREDLLYFNTERSITIPRSAALALGLWASCIEEGPLPFERAITRLHELGCSQNEEREFLDYLLNPDVGYFVVDTRTLPPGEKIAPSPRLDFEEEHLRLLSEEWEDNGELLDETFYEEELSGASRIGWWTE